MSVQVIVDQSRCKGCQYCISSCPKEVFSVSKEKNARGYDYVLAENADECIGCRQCSVICPDAAISLYKDEED